MVAWRARIGLIKPTHRGKSFAYWYKNAPEGVEIVPTFIGFRSEKPESFLAGFKKAEDLAVQLKEVGCDIISVSGTPPFLLKGLDFERQWAADLSAKSGCRSSLRWSRMRSHSERWECERSRWQPITATS